MVFENGEWVKGSRGDSDMKKNATQHNAHMISTLKEEEEKVKLGLEDGKYNSGDKHMGLKDNNSSEGKSEYHKFMHTSLHAQNMDGVQSFMMSDAEEKYEVSEPDCAREEEKSRVAVMTNREYSENSSHVKRFGPTLDSSRPFFDIVRNAGTEEPSPSDSNMDTDEIEAHLVSEEESTLTKWQKGKLEFVRKVESCLDNSEGSGIMPAQKSKALQQLAEGTISAGSARIWNEESKSLSQESNFHSDMVKVSFVTRKEVNEDIEKAMKPRDEKLAKIESDVQSILDKFEKHFPSGQNTPKKDNNMQPDM